MKAKLLTGDPYNKGLVSLHWVPHHKYTQEGKRALGKVMYKMGSGNRALDIS